MNALHTATPARGLAVHRTVERRHAAARRSFDWAGQIKLAIVLSVVAAIAVTALAGRVAEPVLIVGIIVVASFAAWARIEPVAEPARVPVRRR
ncbi:MAG: hypothetical protein WCC60_13360 [Ilumatobacteraceae bacterium]